MVSLLTELGIHHYGAFRRCQVIVRFETAHCGDAGSRRRLHSSGQTRRQIPESSQVGHVRPPCVCLPERETCRGRDGSELVCPCNRVADKVMRQTGMIVPSDTSTGVRSRSGRVARSPPRIIYTARGLARMLNRYRRDELPALGPHLSHPPGSFEQGSALSSAYFRIAADNVGAVAASRRSRKYHEPATSDSRASAARASVIAGSLLDSAATLSATCLQQHDALDDQFKSIAGTRLCICDLLLSEGLELRGEWTRCWL